MRIQDRIIVALDVNTVDVGLAIAEQLDGIAGIFKTGLQLIHGEGTPKILEAFNRIRAKILFDAKLHDIPNTVAQAAAQISRQKAAMFNVMASGGVDMMMAAVANKGESEVFAVTVLTSLDEENANLLLGGPTKVKVLQYARDAKLAGVDGIICSPLEAQLLLSRPELRGMRIITPGIRPSGSESHDQKRTNTPYGAILNGVDHLVIGRAITGTPNMAEAARNILDEIELGLLHRLLLMLFDQGHIKFGEFRLKLHDNHPEAPLSPIYINLREMSAEVLGLIAELLLYKAEKLGLKRDCVIGIPKAGNPIAKALCNLSGDRRLEMVKDESGPKRRVTSEIKGRFNPGWKALMVDDLITKADTKLEAISGVKANDMKVTDLLVVFDREQGGGDAMKKEGINLHSLTTLSEALALYVRQGRIDPKKRDQVQTGIQALEDYMASQT